MSCEIEVTDELPFFPSSLLISSNAPRVYDGVVRRMYKLAAPIANITHIAISFQCDKMIWKKSSKLKTSSTSWFCVVIACCSFTIISYKLFAVYTCDKSTYIFLK